MLNEDYKDMLLALSGEKVKYLLVGAHAMVVHGYARSTIDLDLWIEATEENAEAVMRALSEFGAPLQGLTTEDLQKEGTVFQIGVAPKRIDIITDASGLVFEEAFARALSVRIEGVKLSVLSLEDLIRNKKAAGRTKDLADVEALEELQISRKT